VSKVAKPVSVVITRPPTVATSPVIVVGTPPVFSPTRNYTVKSTTRAEIIAEAVALAHAEGFDTVEISTYNLPPN
jgi:hypothetical protein